MIRLASSEFGNMKKSSDWVRQPALDKMLDQLVEERGCTPAELVTYDAAKALEIEPSGEFYKKVRDWKQRRAAERHAPVMEVPPHVQADFRETVDRFANDAMASFLHAVRLIGGDLNRTATLRVADAERRAEDAQAEVNGLLDHWTAAEAARDAAMARVAELEQALADSQRREDVLTARLEERDAFLKSVKLAASKIETAVPAVTDIEPSAKGGDGTRDRQTSDVLIDIAPVPANQPVADTPAGEPERPTAIAADRPKGGQAAMQSVTSDDAVQADVAGDDPG